jgi:hypothetical protein
VNQRPSAASESLLQSAAKRTHTLDWERLGFLYARIALGAAFLSGIADRFGLYGGRNVGICAQTPNPRFTVGLEHRAPMSALAVAVIQPAPNITPSLPAFLCILSGKRQLHEKGQHRRPGG